MNFHSQYQSCVSDWNPSTKEIFKNEDWKNIIFPEALSISDQTAAQIKEIASRLYQLKKDPTYLDSLKEKAPAICQIGHPQDSVLMSFDFHLDAEARPRLIEVNTNSSGFLIGVSLSRLHALPYQQSLKSLIEAFKKEWRKFKGQTTSLPQRVGIIDESPYSQKMIVEFFMYQDFFKSFGWKSQIYDVTFLKTDSQGHLRNKEGQRIDFCYNRHTDFYFKNSPYLKESYSKSQCAFSPHPTEYFLLADKNRLCDWSLHKEKWPLLSRIQNNLLDTFKLSLKNQEQAWQHKKKYIFKLAGKHGGKGVYRGQNLTRKTFQMLCQNETVFQDYLPAPRWEDSEGIKWKFDLRAFVYAGQVQQIIARCYQGQLTNFKNFGGGMAPVCVINQKENALKRLILPENGKT